MSDEQTRFRSFAERYIVERASTFTGTHSEQLQQAWGVVDEAKTVYKHIDDVSKNLNMDPGQVACMAGGAKSFMGTVKPSSPEDTYNKLVSSGYSVTEAMEKVKQVFQRMTNPPAVVK